MNRNPLYHPQQVHGKGNQFSIKRPLPWELYAQLSLKRSWSWSINEGSRYRFPFLFTL